jgi:hypothetical protein
MEGAMARRRRKLVDPGKVRQVPVEYYGIEDIDVKYSDGLLVQSDESGFIISFFQTQHPVTLTEEERIKVRKIRTKCVARVFVSPPIFEVTIEALARNLEKYNALFVEGSDVDRTDASTEQEVGE